MSRRKTTTTTVYVVRSNEGGCGHQHANEQAARNCAQNLVYRLTRDTGLAQTADIVQVTLGSTNPPEKRVARV